MRSALFAGIPARHTPAHAKPTRLPVVATTAGLTLSLVPAVLGATASTATAATPVTAATASAAAAKGYRIPTHLAISELGRVTAGTAAVNTALVTKNQLQYFPAKRVHFQAFFGGRWRTVAAATTNANGVARVAVPLMGGTQVRSYFPGQTAIVGNVSRPVRVGGPIRLTLGQRAVLEARKHYGKAYRYGATGPSNFDCSGFSSYVFRQLGRSLPRTSAAQAAAVRRIPTSARAVGDLIFTYTNGRVTHVGIYAGGNQMWAATKTGDIVRLQTLYSRSITVGRVA
jgi:cell wall-associated NlpC family hydrolase